VQRKVCFFYRSALFQPTDKNCHNAALYAAMSAPSPVFNSRENSVFSESQCLKCAICIGERFTLSDSQQISLRILSCRWGISTVFKTSLAANQDTMRTLSWCRRCVLERNSYFRTVTKRKQAVNLRIFQTSKTDHSPYAYCANAILWQRTDCFIWEAPDSKY
jgi:hypothetical protein